MKYLITLDRDFYSKHRIIYNWCIEQFGDHFLDHWSSDRLRWHVNIVFGHQQYKFRLEEDATLFLLKWGGQMRTEDDTA